MSNGALWMIRSAPCTKSRNSVGDLRELRFVAQEFGGQPVDRQCARIAVAFRVDVEVQVVAREPAVHQLDAADFDNAVAGARIQAGGFGIEDELTHVGLARSKNCWRKHERRSARSSCRRARAPARITFPRATRRRDWRAHRRVRFPDARRGLSPSAIRSRAAATGASSRFQRSAFFTGVFAAVIQFFFFQPWIHSLMPFCTYCESVCTTALHGPLQRFERGDHAPSAPCGCWWCWLRRRTFLFPARRSAAARPSRRGRDCPCRRRRYKYR